MQLAHTMIRVRDLEATIRFYTEFLGLREVKRGTIGDEATLVFLTDESESYHIELTYNHDGREYELGTQFGHLAFFAEDLEPIVAKLEKEGRWFRRSKPGNRSKYIFVKDPNDYDVEILEKRS